MRLPDFRKISRSNWMRFSMLALIGLFSAPLLIRDLYVLRVLATLYLATVYTSSWNLMAKSGQASLGHGAFFGLGAYGSVLLARNLQITPWLTMFAGSLLPAAVASGLGLVCTRLRLWFMGIVTFGLTVIAQALIVEQFGWLTNRWDGLLAPPVFPLGVEGIRYAYYSSAFAMVFAFIIMYLIFHSKFGLALSMIRSRELVASASGINVVKYKTVAFILSAYIAGVAGALQTHTLNRHLEPSIFDLETSIYPILYAAAGGLGTLPGPIVGTFAVGGPWEALVRGLGGFYAVLALGLLLAVIIVLVPGGFVSLITKIKWRMGRIL